MTTAFVLTIAASLVTTRGKEEELRQLSFPCGVVDMHHVLEPTTHVQFGDVMGEL